MQSGITNLQILISTLIHRLITSNYSAVLLLFLRFYSCNSYEVDI